MTDREVYATGNVALDQILSGGIPRGAAILIAGLPGTGKTILAQQVLFNNVSETCPAIYLTTLGEPLDKVIRYVQRFTFFDAEKLPGIIHYQDIAQEIQERGIEALPRIVENLILERGAAFVVIDSFKAVHDLSPDQIAFRAALFNLARIFAATGVTALLLGEYGSDDISVLPEFAVADGLIELCNRSYGVRDERTLRVHKLRGTSYLSGEHSLRIGADGIQAFPRLVGDEARHSSHPDERVTSGVPGLDPLLGGGLWRGSTTLLEGPTGVGKTMLGLRYLLSGVTTGEPAVLVTFEDYPRNVRRVLDGFGIDTAALEAEGLLQIVYASPLELGLVELFSHLKEMLQAQRARRLLVDSLNDMQEAAIESSRFRAVIWSLAGYVHTTGATCMLTLETPLEVRGLDGPASERSHMANNLLQLRYVDDAPGEYTRSIRVRKARSSAHDPLPHPYHIDERGPRVDPRPIITR